MSAFPMKMAEFFTLDVEGQEDVVFRAAELPDAGTGDIQYRLVAAGRRDRKMSIHGKPAILTAIPARIC